ncbi:unnamed protein product [Medioppia subpectinata]|uniref:Nuclear receptor-binding factor 2 MIT domain-containing protein n=1 Tax=Medioppia subpectinata TaxID=1979941 RepID=A0A7R9KG08_9ACAR|nr:unnamed protein product [Medioppia subpectinata]CAG2101654.1 unnamed protein product [Medioppia subpectinata]
MSVECNGFPMDSPLNLAHRCHRKAEYYLNDNRFKEAVDYHLKAAGQSSGAQTSGRHVFAQQVDDHRVVVDKHSDTTPLDGWHQIVIVIIVVVVVGVVAVGCHIQEALLSTTCALMKASLETQKAYHLSQEAVLKQRDECQRQQVLTRKQELLQRQQLIDKFGHQMATQLTPGGETPGGDSGLTSAATTAGHTMDTNSKASVMSELRDIMSEHDSLLHILIERRSDIEAEVKPSVVTGAEPLSSSNSSADSMYKSGSKKPKTDKTVIEELQTVNEKLKQLVFQLAEELDACQREIRDLRAQNMVLKAENSHVSTVPELPPLEPPELLY